MTQYTKQKISKADYTCCPPNQAGEVPDGGNRRQLQFQKKKHSVASEYIII